MTSAYVPDESSGERVTPLERAVRGAIVLVVAVAVALLVIY